MSNNMNNSSLKICALIPTYNNSSTIADVVKRTHKQLNNIIVVVDGSTDNTIDILNELNLPITIVTYPKNRGKGYALKVGFRKAKELGFDYALTIDADGQHFPEDIPALIDLEQRHPDSLIIGCRKLQNDNMPKKNTFANKFSNFWYMIQTGMYLPDTQSGFRIYPLKHLSCLSLITNRYESELELLVFLTWAEVRVLYTPIHVYYPPQEERVSHFKPIYDFTRISILNSLLCIIAIVYGLPRRYLLSILFVIKLLLISCILSPWALGILMLRRNKTLAKKNFHFVTHKLVKWLINHVDGAKFSIKGKQFASSSKPVMYIANHESLLDLLIVLALQPKMIVITKNWVHKNLVFGWISQALNCYSVSDGLDNLVPKLQNLINLGYSIVIFPEGTRTLDGKVLRFHSGAFYLADKLNLDIQPLIMHNTFHILNKVDFRLFKGEFAVEYLPVVSKDSTIFGNTYRKKAKSFEAFYSNIIMNKKEIIIIGAGVGGLFTGALLSKEGYKVTILEQLPIIGGALYSYTRLDEIWQTGIHIVCGLEDGGIVKTIFDELGFDLKLDQAESDIVHGEEKLSRFSILYGGENSNDEIKNRIIDLFSQGTYRFVGGTQQLVDALCLYIVRHGGQIVTNEKINKIVIENGNVKEVCSQKHIWNADIVISSLHPKILLDICTQPIFRNVTINRIKNTPESYGSFKLYIKFKKNSFQYLKSNHYILPENIFFYTQPIENQGQWANTMEVVMPLPYDEIKQWSSCDRKNSIEYENYKKQKADYLFSKIETIYPNFKDLVDNYFTSTSLTFRDVYATPEGSMFGLNEPVGTCNTKINNLFLAGQNVYLHGFCGTIQAATQVVQTIKEKFANE